MLHTFTIEGNQEDRIGNAIPKIKKTRGQYWTPAAQRYAAWKNYVQKCFIESLTGDDLVKIPSKVLRIAEEKPLCIGTLRARMDLRIRWHDGKHADGENVFGSIADALFQNDKNLDGSFESIRAPDGKGRVEVRIELKKPSE